MNKINWQERLNQLLSTGKNKSYFTVGVTILFVVIMSIIGVVPALSSLSLQAEDNIERDKIIAKLEKKLDDLKSLTLAKESNESLVDYFNEIMPEEKPQEKGINLINSYASKYGLFISSFTFEKENRTLLDRVANLYGERIAPISFSINGTGSREGVISFFSDLEESARIIDIQEYIVNRVAIFNEAGVFTGVTYNLNAKLVIYYYK